MRKPAVLIPTPYYTASYFSGECSDGYLDYQGSEPVLRANSRIVSILSAAFACPGRLLDLGCAYGFFLKEAQRHFDVTGIELAEDAALGLPAVRVAGLFRRLPMRPRWRASERSTLSPCSTHTSTFPQPRDTLALCSRYRQARRDHRADHRRFCCPLTARWAGAKWRLMTPPQHLWFFTRESLRRMAPPLGLSMEHFDHPGKIVPLSLIVFQLKRMIGMRGSQLRPRAVSACGQPLSMHASGAAQRNDMSEQDEQ